MKIKMVEKNREKLLAAIEYAQRWATVRCTFPSYVEALIKVLETSLSSKGLPKKLWVGMRFVLNPNAQRFPHAYKYCPEATVVEITRCNSGWFMTGAYRGTCTDKRITLQSKLTADQEQAILAHAKKEW